MGTRKIKNKKILFLLVGVILLILIALFINKIMNKPISKDELIEQIKKEQDVAKVVFICYEGIGRWLLVDCPRESLCTPDKSLDKLLDLVKNENDKTKFDLLCEEIERKMKQKGEPIEDKWKAENCKKRYFIQ